MCRQGLERRTRCARCCSLCDFCLAAGFSAGAGCCSDLPPPMRLSRLARVLTNYKLILSHPCFLRCAALMQGQQWPPPEAVLLPPDWPEGDLDLLPEEAAIENAAVEAAAAAVAAALAAQAPPGQAANVLAGPAAEQPGHAEGEEAAAAAVLQQAIDAVEAAEHLLHNPAQQAQQQDGQQAHQAVQHMEQAQQQRRPGLFGRLLRRRRGNG